MSNEVKMQRRLGTIMWLLAWGLALALLTWYFQQRADSRHNPNQQVQVVNEQGRQGIVLKQNRHGHYLANGKMNNKAVVFLLDTGASLVAVPEGLADELALALGQPIKLNTAAGRVTGYRTRINSLSLGPFTLKDVSAVIMPADSNEVLLGMNVLRQFELTQREGQMIIRR
ncbi:retropepsin-like aspartic protease family protein [Oceanisphaera pacifica]|uniref:TIGR02281 family clan AA aspartic protease n=1 Tax=Oceanisphaera pacifica TaxID=2818389 RepID=A0ABS3NCP3_9GAMM|nr:TIGR02281 family clan AA aspartic protease [Oceanisphaera pacifica]MBO1518147.1 TIGR02281 family clan AA aspartic protease [Oceanisphaera pacifica]